MTGGSAAPCTRARAPSGGRGLSHTVGRERCSRWRRLACGWACAVCHLSSFLVMALHQCDRHRSRSEMARSTVLRVVWMLNTLQMFETEKSTLAAVR